jgi:hypothetical protein
LPENSVLYLSAAPFAGNVAVGVGKVHHEPSSSVRVYVWTANGKTPLPPAFHDDKKLAKKIIEPLEKRDQSDCIADGPEGRSCYRVQLGAILSGKQPAGRFTFGGTRYEISFTGWSADISGYPDSLSLALYAGAPAAR